MYQINKQEFGAFVAALRKKKGLTQKELAAKLTISDKAVSKWETGVSIPDVAMLVPLAEVLEVSVTELLTCRRTGPALDAAQVEDLVKTAISYSEETIPSRRRFRRKGFLLYLLLLAASMAEMALMHHLGFTRFSLGESIMVVLVLCAIFGLYFMVFAAQKLPDYYDQNRIHAFSDGPVHMNIPGVTISNRNWPHLVKVGRFWSMGTLILYPLLSIALNLLAPAFWTAYEPAILLPLLLTSLFLPLMIVGRKYQ